MSYLLVVIIGAVAGWVVGNNMKGSEDGVGIDLAAGAIGAVVAVVIARVVGPAGASGIVMTIVMAILGATALLYAMRRFRKARLAPAPRASRRRQ